MTATGRPEDVRPSREMSASSVAMIGLWAMKGMPEWKGNFDPFLPMGVGSIFSAMGLTFIAFRMRKTHPKLPRGFRVPLVPALGVLSGKRRRIG